MRPHNLSTMLAVVLALGLASPALARELDPAKFFKSHTGKRLERKLGPAGAATFLQQVRVAPISLKEQTWTLKFASHQRGTPGVLEKLVQAHQMDPSGKMEEAVRDYARVYSKHEGAVNTHSVPDSKFLEKAEHVREKLGKLEQKPGVVIFFDGPDGAGKTSISRRIGEALQGPYTVLPKIPHLGKPEAGKAWATWVKEQLGVPAKKSGQPWVAPGQVMFVDRSLLGEVVYNSKDPTAAGRVRALEAELEKTQGVKVLHVVLVPSQEKVTHTYGKRLARSLYVSEVTPGSPAPALVSAADGPAFAQFGTVSRAFTKTARDFSANTILVDASDRDDARVKILDWVGHSIRHEAKRRAEANQD